MTTTAEPRTPQLGELLKMAIRSQLENVHVALPGRVTKYDVTEQRANVQPLLNRPVVTEDGEELDPEKLPEITDVPVMFPRAGGQPGGFFMSWPLQAGDFVLLVFNERSIDTWITSQAGAEATPASLHTHDLSDAVAFPGFYPYKLALGDADATDLALGREAGMQLHITPTDVAEFQVGGVADKSVAIAENLKTWLINHTHPTGVGPSGFPTQAYDDNITSNNLKVRGN